MGFGSFGVANAWLYAIEEVNRSNSQENTKDMQHITKNTQNTARLFHNSMNEMVTYINTANKVQLTQGVQNTKEIVDADWKARKQITLNKQTADVVKETEKVKKDYGMATGQGYAPCRVVTQNVETSKVVKDVKGFAESISENSDNSAGKLVRSRAETGRNRQAVHLQHFCNETDKANGLCSSVSGQANADVNATVLFTPAQIGSKTDIAKDMVRQNMMGDAHEAISPSVGKTAMGQAYLYETNQHTAMKAFPNYTLSYVQGMTTTREDIKDAKEAPMSPLEKLQATVGRYYGGTESNEWQKSLVVQRPRGLLVELTNQQDITIYLLHEMSKLQEMKIGTKASGLLAMTDALDKDSVRQFNALRRLNSSQNARAE